MVDYITDRLNLMNCDGCELVMILPFKEGNYWYFQLRYHVVKTDGEEGELIIPKVNNPFYSNRPTIEVEERTLYDPIYSLRLNMENPIVEKTTYEGHDCVYYYVKTKDAPVKEMTHEEIEKELGHPFVEINLCRKKKGGK